MSVTHTPTNKGGAGSSGSSKKSDSISEQKRLQQLKENLRKMEEELKVLVHQRGAVKGKLTRIKSALAASIFDEPNENLKNIHFLRLHHKTVENCYQEYNEFQNRIYSLPLSDEKRNEQEARYIEFEELYNELCIKLNMLMATVAKEEARLSVVPAAPIVPGTAAAPATGPAIMHIPPLKVPLPTFDGSYENWLSFKCMFQTIMARYQAESPAIKLYHLRNALTGKATGIIDQDIINNNDYNAAWALLEERYQDTRLIIDKHIEALFSLPAIPKESAISLRKLVDTCTKNVSALENLQLPVNGLGEQMLINVLSSKLDKETRKAWETKQVAGQLPAYAATINFLKERCRILEKIDVNTKPTAETTKPPRTVARSNTLVATSEQKCSVCKNNHDIWKCEEFKKNNVNEKYNTLKKSGSCFNCLQKGHRTNECPSTSSCKKCNKKHHTLLHPDEKKSAETVAAAKPIETEGNRTEERQTRTESAPESTSTATLCAQVETAKKQTLLATAVVLVYGHGGAAYQCRALLDSASQTHFVTERFANLLSLEKKPTNFHVSGLNGTDTRIRFKILTRVQSLHSGFNTELDLLIAPKITGELPSQTLDIRKWPLPSGIKLADPAFFKKNRIDMLIGADVFWNLIKTEKLQLAPGLPTLRDTEFGWIVGGTVAASNTDKPRTLCIATEEERLSDILKKFWTIEGSDELLQRGPSQDTANTECLEHYRQTHQRTNEGRYIVRLPFNERKSQLGDSREMAKKRFLNVERRLDREPMLKQQYADFMHEYESLGHMREVPSEEVEQSGESYHLPHHCVLRPTSTTTKLRVVFDGSAKTSTGISINDVLLAGPTVQNDLVAILLGFRCFEYALTLDIPKMYRQVGIHPDDARFQRVFWRDDRTQPLKLYELLTVTYGIASSPFQATMTLNQLADDHGEEYPRAARAIKNCCYIDDILAGANDLHDALKLQQELIGLLRRGCFDAHKWCSNSPSLLEPIPEDRRGTALNVAEIDTNAVVKTLGVAWHPAKDSFTYSVSTAIATEDTLTKRKLLSAVAKIYDPEGFIGPTLTSAKLILREAGLLETDWDHPVPQSTAKRWQSFRDELPALNELHFPRWILCKELAFAELHGFADASDQAYGACLYTRLIRLDGSVEMRLICSKSRLLPKATKKSKAITTPRAELLAAVLLSHLTNKFLTSTDLTWASIILWSDSQIVLSWIRKCPEQLMIYVSNRVAEIQRLTGKYRWRYVPTDCNPADLISRGLSPCKMLENRLWWDGPAMLRTTDAPDEPVPAVPDNELPELKTAVTLAQTTTERMKIFDDVSDYTKLQRHMAYLVRFAVYLVSKRKTLIKGRLTVQELLRAEKVIVRLVQAETFRPEKVAILEDRSARHRLSGLNPFIDDEGILRVGGRIKHAFIPFDSRHQMMLPAKHPVTEMLIRKLHTENLHIGQRSLLAVVRRRFWPLNVKTTIRKVTRRCITCFRVNPMKTTQLMGDLPSDRVRSAPTFARTGIDFAGPFWIKSNADVRKPIITKGYVCLFVCMCTRAIHLELVSNLSSEAFLAALRRFSSRRGYPSVIWSDNGTNLVGGNNELEELRRLLNDELHLKKLDQYCTSEGIEWRFIPPRSPHFGGIWEAGVKSVKYHMKRIVGSRRLTFEELYTSLTQIEAVLNSRPLTQSSDDPNDFTAITPAHFLVGRELTAVPEPSYLELKESTLSRWQLVQTIMQHFWKRWLHDYLPELQNRQKWFKKTKIKPGALVLIVDKNAPPMQWPLARIIALHPGADNVTRVVTLTTPKGGETKRAVHEICLLPLDEDEQ